uniref:Uncharacterized protein n=1 Tax=Anguilla anguilla TaxID=7936 RepID=A0A0E9XR79_ANGAN
MPKATVPSKTPCGRWQETSEGTRLKGETHYALVSSGFRLLTNMVSQSVFTSAKLVATKQNS